MGGRGATSKNILPIEAYRVFTEGESDKIHAVIFKGTKDDNQSTTSSYDAKYKNYPKAIDKIMTPAEDDIHVYKGISASKEEISKMKGIKTNISYSSTSIAKVTAESYKDNAYNFEDDDHIPVLMNITIKKGTPVVDARKILGSGGMHGFEKEITVGRNTKWNYKNLHKVRGIDGTTEYVVDVEVSK